MKFRKNENNRSDRSFNAAVGILLMHKSGMKEVPTKELRAKTRAHIGLPKLGPSTDTEENEKFLGDLRAHGDAIGGHGLKLDIKRFTGNTRVIPFTPDNIKKCQDFVGKFEKPPEVDPFKDVPVE